MKGPGAYGGEEVNREEFYYVSGSLSHICTIISFFTGAYYAARLTSKQHPLRQHPFPRKALFRFLAVLLVVLGLAFMVSLVGPWRAFMASFAKDEKAALFTILQRRDPELFWRATVESFEIPRVFPDRTILAAQSDLKRSLQRADKSFALLAPTGSSIIGDFHEHVMNAVGRGVRVRFLFLDPDEANKASWDLHAQFVNTSSETSRKRALERQETLRKMIALTKDKRAYKGELQVGYIQKPLVYSMWIADAGIAESSVGHIEIELHSKFPDWPAFRVSKDGAALVRVLCKNFDQLWGDAKKLEAQQ